MRILLLVVLLLVSPSAWAIGPPCDEEIASGTGDVCIGGGEDLNTQSYKRSFLDPLTGATCSDADKGEGSMWMAHDFDANPLIGTLVAICIDNADMDPEPGGSLLIPARGTLTGAARRAAALQGVGESEYACAIEADAGRIQVNKDSDPASLCWCHWDGATASNRCAALGNGADGLPVLIGTTSDFDSSCDATGTFTNGDTAITLADYTNTDAQTQITATISFTAVVAATFTIKAKLEGVQVGTDVKCSAATGFSTSCTIAILDAGTGAGQTFTITVAQSTGVLNTIDTCNVTRLTVHN